MSGKVHFVVRPLNEREIPDNVEDKVLAKTYLEIAYGLNGEVEPFGWDLPPRLMMLRVKARGDLPGAQAIVVDGTSLPGFHELVSKYMNQGGRMHHALLHAAEAWHALAQLPLFRKLDVSEVKGIAMIHEGWLLMTNTDDEEQRKEHTRVADERKIHEHPERVECRMIHISGPDGLRVSLNAPRDGVPMQMIGQAKPGMHPSQYQVAGDVPNALQFMLEVIQGKADPEAWQEWWRQYHWDDLIDQPS